jgi:hypothetical protein
MQRLVLRVFLLLCSSRVDLSLMITSRTKNPSDFHARNSFLVEPSRIEPLSSTLPVLRAHELNNCFLSKSVFYPLRILHRLHFQITILI